MEILITESQLESLLSNKELDTKLEKQNNFISRAKEIHKDENGEPLYDYSLVDYTGEQNKVKIICPRHKDKWKNTTGNEYFEITPNHHTNRGSKCKFCDLERKTKYTDKDIEDAAKKYNTAIEFKTKDFPFYNAARKRDKNKEVKEFWNKVTSHFKTAKESQGETTISEILVKHNLINKDCVGNSRCENREKEFEQCTNQKIGKYCRTLRFDFYIPEQNTLIEWDGEQHFTKSGRFGEGFETLQQNDIIKNKFCKDNGIKLIRLHYKLHKIGNIDQTGKIEELLLRALKSPKEQIFIGPY